MTEYLIEFALLHLAFFIIYKLTLRKETDVAFLRMYILASSLLAIAVPLIHLDAGTSVPNVAANIYLVAMEPLQAGPETQTATPINDYSWLFPTVTSLLGLWLLIGLVRIAQFYRKSTRFRMKPDVRDLPDSRTSFTFYRTIFIDRRHFEHIDDVIVHEMGHIRFGHFYDLIFLRLLSIVFWWVPSVWVYLIEIKKIHEFQADAFALQSGQRTYLKTLVETTLQHHGLGLANSFGDISITDRLKFMKTMKKKINRWKLTSLLGVILSCILLVACAEEFEREVQNLNAESAVAGDYSEEVAKELQRLQSENPDVKYEVLISKESNKERFEQLQTMDPRRVELVLMNQDEADDERTISVIVRKSEADLARLNAANAKDGDRVYTLVDQQPEFPGGRDAFRDYLLSALKYPEDAKRDGIEGKVFVEFVVNQNGSIDKVQAVKGIHPALNKAAEEVIRDMPNFEPGLHDAKPVKVRMVLPIDFRL